MKKNILRILSVSLVLCINLLAANCAKTEAAMPSEASSIKPPHVLGANCSGLDAENEKKCKAHKTIKIHNRSKASIEASK